MSAAPLLLNPDYLHTFGGVLLGYCGQRWQIAEPGRLYVCTIAGIVDGHTFRSPVGAPWGGVVGGHLDHVLPDLLAFVRSDLGCATLTMTTPQHDGLLWPDVVDRRLSFVATPRTWSHQAMTKGMRKKLRQGIERGQQTYETTDIDTVYDIIQRNRQAIGTRMTVSLPKFHAQYATMPDAYRLWITAGDEPMAAAITVQLTRDVLYVYKWGELPQYRTHSPVVHLFDAIMTTTDSALVDLGTAFRAEGECAGLRRFKENLGCHAMPLFTYCMSASTAKARILTGVL